MGNDSMRFDEFGFFCTYLVTGPLQTAIVVYFLWSYLGVACLSGLLILLLFIPFQSVMGRLFSKIRSVNHLNLLKHNLKTLNIISDWALQS